MQEGKKVSGCDQTISSPFKRTLFWPQKASTPNKRSKEKVPSVATSEEWKKREKKERIEKEKEERQNKRKENKKIREQKKGATKQKRKEILQNNHLILLLIFC